MSLRIDSSARRIELGVGDLLPAEEVDPFAPGHSSLARLLMGSRAHAAYARQNLAVDETFESEVVIKRDLEIEGWTLHVAGRIDGTRREDGALVVEELKSVIMNRDRFLELDSQSYPAYLLQLRLYLYLLGLELERDEPAPRGRLVFTNLTDGAERAFDVELDRDAVHQQIVARVREILIDHGRREQRRARRVDLGKRLAFPFPSRRAHQEEMEVECLEALDSGECALVSAPPGLGKTAAALSAALRHALLNDRRVYFVTSKTTQQQLVTRTLQRMAELNPGLTAVILRAKAKICANETVLCHPDVCEYARDYPVKTISGGSLERLLANGVGTPDDIYAEGLRVRACPFELSLDLTESADVVVGDFNYVFDPSVALRRQLDDGSASDLVLVVDEAHNLLDRARDYYSPTLSEAVARELLMTTQVRTGDVFRTLEGWLESLLRFFARLRREVDGEPPLDDRTEDPPQFRVDRHASSIRRRRTDLERFLLSYMAFRRDGGGVQADDPILDFTFEFLRFARVLDLEGDEFVYLLQVGHDGLASYRIVCLDPSRQLRKRLDSFHAVIAMSATLEPTAYYRDLLGFQRERTRTVQLPSPFDSDQRRIMVVPTIATTWRERDRWYGKVAATLRDLYDTRDGHWVVFFPSFRYLREIESRLGRVGGELLTQHEGMSDFDRREVIERLQRPDGRPRLLLAVLGGVFAEGVDLPGDALVGVVVVSPGLPRVSVERELFKRRFDELYGLGFDYAYLIPGLSRVVQAAGRLVRSERDRGVVVLLDRRFASPSYTRYFPRDWYDSSPSELVERDPEGAVRAFFAEVDEQAAQLRLPDL